MYMKMVYCFLLILSVFLIVAFACVAGYGLWGAKGLTSAELDGLCVVAHRGGACAELPENSLACIARTVEDGAVVIEVDVRITKDGELVVFHDEAVDDKTDGSGRVCDMLLGDLRSLRLKNRAGMLTDECVPTLGDVLWLVNGRCRLLIDAKCTAADDAERFAKALINEVALYNAADWVSVQSFSDGVLENLHRLGHPFPLEKLLLFKFPGLPLAFDRGVVFFSFMKYDYISSFNFFYRTLPPSLVDVFHKNGKRVKVWTPATPEDMPRLNVDGVITDFPSQW